MQGLVRGVNSDVGPPQGHGHRDAEHPAQKHGGQAVRVGEVGVDELKAEPFSEPEDIIHDRQEQKHAVQALAKPRQADKAGVMDPDPVLILQSRNPRPVARLQDVCQGKPGHRGQHLHLVRGSHPLHPLPDEQAQAGLGLVGVDRGEDEEDHIGWEAHISWEAGRPKFYESTK